ncbi:MAG TPA: BrnT family toxin [Allosphingosinicella sp.]|nr:BrnT family toxin [Allosphingosinicella sp.]
MKIEFDPKKEARNRARHKMGFAGAEAMFDGFHIDDEDDREDYRETRFVTLGRIGRQVVVCVWTPRGDKARIISLRKADKDEREIYHLYRP